MFLISPSSHSQAIVAQSLDEAKGPIGALASQVVPPSNLTDDISDASDGLKLALEGAQGVLDASGLSPADVGLDAPLVANDPATPAPSASPSTGR